MGTGGVVGAREEGRKERSRGRGGTYRLVEDQQLDLRTPCAHEGARDGYTLPLDGNSAFQNRVGLQTPRTTFSRKTKTYLPAGEPVEFVGRGAVAAEHVAAAAKLITVQPCADAVGQRADEIYGAGEL